VERVDKGVDALKAEVRDKRLVVETTSTSSLFIVIIIVIIIENRQTERTLFVTIGMYGFRAIPSCIGGSSGDGWVTDYACEVRSISLV